MTVERRWSLTSERISELQERVDKLLSTLNVHECVAMRDMLSEALVTHEEPPANRTEDLVTALRDARNSLEEMSATSFDGPPAASLYLRAAAEIERLQETLTCPRLTLTASTEQITAVLHDWDKGRPVNTQDLVNALAWRVGNQRREISRLNEALRRKASDEAPSFSPNFDERNGIR